MLQTTTSRFEIPGFALPIRYLGMGVYLAWIYSVQFGSTTSPSPIPGATVEPLFLISNFMNALALIICALNARRIMAHPRRTIIPWVAGVFMCVGTLLMALPSTFLAEAHMMDQLIVIASVGDLCLPVSDLLQSFCSGASFMPHFPCDKLRCIIPVRFFLRLYFIF